MIAKESKSAIRKLLQDPNWRAVEQLAEDVISKINADDTVRDTEWDTVKATLEQSGKTSGIRQFIQELYAQAQE